MGLILGYYSIFCCLLVNFAPAPVQGNRQLYLYFGVFSGVSATILGNYRRTRHEYTQKTRDEVSRREVEDGPQDNIALPGPRHVCGTVRRERGRAAAQAEVGVGGLQRRF